MKKKNIDRICYKINFEQDNHKKHYANLQKMHTILQKNEKQHLNSTILNCKIGKNCKILNSHLVNCIILGRCVIENCDLKDCFIFENCKLYDSRIYDKVVVEQNSVIRQSYIYDNVHIGKDCTVGPFSHLHCNCDIDDFCRVGNFVEIKKSKLGENTKVAHLSYVGDTEIGNNVNIGAGTIFCTYDGKKKHRCTVGEGSFIGSNCVVIAPRNIGKKCFVGANSCVDEDLGDGIFYLRRSETKKKYSNRSVGDLDD